MVKTGRTTGQIADSITEWGANDIDADAIGAILIRVLRAADEGATGTEIRAIIDDETAD